MAIISTDPYSTGSTSFGANPSNISWTVVRGDTSTFTAEFLENDEVTYIDTTGWQYLATAVDTKTGTSYTLETVGHPGFVNITATSETSSHWGAGLSEKIPDLRFDLQVTIDSNTVWTPIIGRIVVIPDVGGILV
jgi:hypothetical protein